MAAVVLVGSTAGCGSDSTSNSQTTTSTSASSTPVSASVAAPPSPPPPPGPLVQMDQLKGLMPEANQVSATVNVPNLGISESHDSLSLLPDDYVSDMTCVGAVADAAIQPYSESPVVLVRTQDYAPADGSARFSAITSAILYETAQDARDQVTATTKGWQGCSGKSVQVKTVPPATYVIGAPAAAGDVQTLVNNRTVPPEPGGNCGRGISSRSNLVIDVTVCGGDPAVVGATAAALVNLIAGKVPA
ncbi:sensor domain-containing protein [Mycolicibacterium aubagnense]|nr:sensor domain-containing protein [Mycolicibacterium aubagnense]TLH56922.1 hypothetical protein C1S80_22975 [Mycolicibacterium aubagnense]WGI33857.1 sensor domain-containing protein [Mycolicibacterium aubagnense]